MTAALQMTFSFLPGVEGFDEQVISTWKEWEDDQVGHLMDYMIVRSFEIVRNKESFTDSFAEELAWIYDDNENHPFSFQKCCSIAGLDADTLKEGLYRSLPEDKKIVIKLLDTRKKQQTEMDFAERG